MIPSLIAFLDEFPGRMKWIRERAGWSQEDLAGRVGVSRPFITLIERGRKMPSVDIMKAIVTVASRAVPRDVAEQAWLGDLKEKR